jgi:hypothetical protein
MALPADFAGGAGNEKGIPIRVRDLGAFFCAPMTGVAAAFGCSHVEASTSTVHGREALPEAATFRLACYSTLLPLLLVRAFAMDG